jgi:dTDP-glucose 4,6-dehydratase
MMSDYDMPMNIGNPEEVAMLDLAREIIQLAGSRSKIIFQALPEDDPKVRQPDITKAKELLGWEPKVSRHEGLLKTLKYFKMKLGV